ncbi:hypothetical protein ACFLQR_02965 [Verrucomicrobiota bacterium]
MSKNDDIVIDLDFVPDWARHPAGLNVSRSSDRRSPRKNRPASNRQFTRENGNRSNPANRKRRPDAVSPEKMHRRTHQPGPESHASVPDACASDQSQPPIKVSFIPERRGLKPVATWLARTRKAHSLTAVASMFLSKPEFFAVKLETAAAENGSPRMLMYQCTLCKTVFLEKKEAVAHALAKHLNMFYEQEEVQVDPPKGNFLCVAQCELSGELLGPPNYHAYNDSLLDLHKTRFLSLSLDEYRKHIVNKTDQSLIEQWRQKASREFRYRTLQANEPQVFTRRSDVDAHFTEHHASTAVRDGPRFIIPGTVSRSLQSRQLNDAIHETWLRESRFPLRMSIAIHPAFRHLGLYIFKTRSKSAFVTAIHPWPIDPALTTTFIRRILEYLDRYPGTGRQELVEHLQPGAVPGDPDVGEVISQLRWLTDRGHVIEFSDGKLAVPYRKSVHAGLKAT